MLDKRLFGIILITAAILIVPHVARSLHFDNYMLGDTPYYHARMAEHISEYGCLWEDPLDNSAVPFNAYHYILALSAGNGALTITNILPFALGIISAILFYLLIKSYFPRRCFLITLLWIASPIFIYGFTVSGPFSVIVFLNLAGFYLLKKKSWLSLAVFSIIPLFGFTNTAVTLLFIVFFKGEKKISITAVVLMLVISGLYGAFLFSVSQHMSIDGQNLIADNITDLGALIGFNIFTLILSAIGFVISWKHKKLLVVPVIILAMVCMVNGDFKILLNIFVSIFAALGIAALYRMEWEQKLVRNLTVFILVVAISVSTLSYLGHVSFMEPDSATVDALVLLEIGRDGTVLSHKQNGFWIEYFARMPALLDGRSNSTIINETSILFTSRDEEQAASILDEYNIMYIFIDEKTRALMIHDNIIGLEFLMENSQDYRNIYESGDIVIWKYSQKV